MSKTPRTDDQAVRIMFGMLDTVVPVEFSRQLETELADKDKQLAEKRAEIEALMFLVKNQRCCRNCGNHASWNFDTCGFGENPKDENEGPHCRRSDLKRWRPMEYRRAKEAAERGE